MSETATKLITAALELPEADRVAMKDALAQSLGEQVDPELVAELDRRRDRYLSGQARGVTSEELARDILGRGEKQA